MSKLLTVREAAQVLRIGEETVRRLLKKRKLTGRKVGKQWRISDDDIWIFNNENGINHD